MVDGPAAWATLGPFEITYVRSIFARVDFGYNLFSEDCNNLSAGIAFNT